MAQLDSAMRDRIREAHAAGARLIRDKSEPVDVALAVEEHRWHWMPHKVKLVLLAESHVYTTRDDVALSINASSLPQAARSAPAQFVRLVYCLAYGERSLLSGAPVGLKNHGTPQFWRLLGCVAGTDGIRPTVKAWRQIGPRLRWKVGTLLALQARGIWLMDASVHALYKPGGERVPTPEGTPAGRVPGRV